MRWRLRYRSQDIQRLTIARLLLAQPRAVILDEAPDADVGSIGSANILAWHLAGAVGVVVLEAAHAPEDGHVQQTIGRVCIGGDDEWVAFQFDVLYDTETATAGVPALRLGDPDPASDPVPLDSQLATELDAHVNAALDAEFSSQAVELVTTHVTAASAGGRFLQVEAMGTAEFAGEGTTPAQVRALYDRSSGDWVRLDYELGTTSNWADEAEPAVAAR